MSSAFRITQRSVSRTMMEGLQSNLGRMQKLQEQLSSGKQVSRPSDSPVKTVEAMQFRSDLRRTEQYTRNASDGLAWLGTADAALTNSLEMTQRVRQLTLNGMNDGVPPESRRAIAAEIDTLRESMLGVANTRYLNRPLFAGTAAVDNAYGTDGRYQGNTGTVQRTVAPDTGVVVNFTGSEIFGADDDETQLFAVLSKISADLKNGDSVALHKGLDEDLVNLDKALDRMLNGLGQLGARYNRVETMRTIGDDHLLTTRNSLSEVEDIDLPKTIVDLQMQEVAYKAALGATARVVQPSLLDFLR
jgi:flagellar hook-associated protein 3 FlgL